MKSIADLNPSQQEAVKAANGPVMIVAGAGSGKTRVLTYRIAYLISCGVPAHQILALTFTNKAAHEMRSRIVTLVGDSAQSLWMGTFHSVFARILRREADHLGFTKTFTIYDSDDSLGVVKKTMARLGISLQQFNPNMIRARISTAKNQLVLPSDYVARSRDIVDEKTALVYAEYQKSLRKSNALDFDDLLIKPIELFEKNAALLERYQYRFRFLLVDEFQDTNKAQYVMTKLLGGQHRNICIVGDDAQSIYSFRGADIRNILDFERDFPECKQFRLEQNYRSTKTILQAADTLIRFNLNRLNKNLWTENPQGAPVTILDCHDEQDEGQQIVRALQREISSAKLELNDLAILYRTNAQSRALEDALRRSGLPYTIVGGIRFYERKEIKDVISYLRVLVNPQDEESLLRIINVPSRGIGDTSIENIVGYALGKKTTVYAALSEVEQIANLTDRAKRSVVEFRTFLKKFNELAGKLSLSEFSRSMVDELGILRMLKEEGTTEALGRWENIQELLSAISEFASTHSEPTLEQFLEEVALVADIDSWEGTQNAVTLMTLHASKGLEFPVVFVAGMEEGLLPFYSSTIDSSNLEEERRLFYVGITRAERKLYLSHAKVRFRFGDLSYQSESRFLLEIGKENIEYQSGPRRISSLTTGGEGHRQWKSSHTKKTRHAEPKDVDRTPEYESESQEQFEVTRGTIVRHETFGRGKVLALSGSGEGQKAVVQFDDYGIKNLVLRFANLRLG
ncbi:MAG: UvrD-helicase domain-containing protein [Ignavibacteriales bacterium]|nr:UvrD-helicase domain-containing protein [Ignavibacteriales bacterium]